MNRFFRLIAAWLGCGIASLSAADSTSLEPTSSGTLPAVTVTATPIIEGNFTDAYGAGSSIVGQQQIHDLNAQDLGSALRATPGVNISRYNNIGSYGGAGGGAIFIRGLGASRPGSELQTMFDGAPRYNSVFSHSLLDTLSLDPADSIAVYKSPQPQTFGNAFTAIDVTPKQAKDPGFSAQLTGAYGTMNTGIEKVSSGGRIGSFDYYAGQSYRSSDGHRDNSGGTIRDYFFRLGYQLNDNWYASYFGDFTDNFAEDPGLRGQPYHMGNYQTRDIMSVWTIANHYDNAQGFIKPYWNNGQARWLDQGMRASGKPILPTATDNTLIDWDLYGVRAKETFQLWEGGEILTGLDFDTISGKTTAEAYDPANNSAFHRADFQIYSPYVALNHLFGDKNSYYLQPSGGVRGYLHSVFDSELSPFGGLVFGYQNTELHASYARGVNYPGLNVAAFSEAIIPPLANNPATRNAWRNLSAETLNHYEFGVSHRFNPQLKIDSTVFLDDGHHRYILVTPSFGPPIGFENIGSYHNYGVEGSVSYTPIEDFTLFAGMTWLQTSVTGMPYAPEWTASAGFNWNFLKNFRLSMDLLYQDRMYVNPDKAYDRSTANPADNPKVPSFVTVNAKLSYLFTMEKACLKQSEIYLAIENLTDSAYYYRSGYPMPGINGILGVTLNF
ncbi:MAG: TonB-dependent receptor plug domain-containing protein [Verrucomicrobiales bacterium]|jgi:iron complex outermembrane receptor protein|nr:TonB-dependent receptor plug domain-containing protein [Verrucomicrobiales bacterium]